jgi:3-hydroxyacyl-[acyl-carrier-protein] dehydratase
MNEWEEIVSILPHRFPFVLVDRILSWEEGKRIQVLKNVTYNEPFFSGHFPKNPLMPGVLIIESMAQAGGLLIIKSYPQLKDSPAFLVGIDKARFKKEVRPGDQLILNVELKRKVGGMYRLKGKGLVDDEVVAEAEIMVSVNNEK